MERPEVRIIQQQEEEIKPVEISNHEKEMLLGKYGYFNQTTEISESPTNNLSFEEMVRQEEEKRRAENYRKMMKLNEPKPMSFDGNYQSDVKYGSDSDSGLSFKIEIVTNMNLPK